MKNLFDILVAQLRDLYSAESQLTVALPHMIEAAMDATLGSTLLNHLAETEEQVDRLDEIAGLLGVVLDGTECRAMRGLIRECSHVIEDNYDDNALRDVMIVASAQRIEHYEIAGYGNAIALAHQLNLSEVAALLQESIEEEGAADKAMSSLCQAQLFGACDYAGNGQMRVEART